MYDKINSTILEEVFKKHLLIMSVNWPRIFASFTTLLSRPIKFAPFLHPDATRAVNKRISDRTTNESTLNYARFVTVFGDLPSLQI